uniref:Ciliary associated calcium binding coiled-coil 1 n=1 Tax=Cyprinus carpio carpio TaxID=630221 RepID=A0A9J8CH84_CYPCA
MPHPLWFPGQQYTDNNMSGRERSREGVRSAENSGKLKRGEETDKDDTVLSEGKKSFPQWELLKQDQINILLSLPVDQVQLQFEDILNIENHQTCVKEAALLEYFVNGFCWAKEMNFSSQQISFIMALLQQLLDNIKNKQSFADNFKTFIQTVLASKASFLFTTTDQIKAITDYFKTSLFQHYRLYELIFNHRREEQLLKIEKCIEVINPAEFAAPLEEGMPTDLYFHYMAPPRVQTPEQTMQASHEENVEEPGKAELEESPGNQVGFSVEDVREVLGEMTQEMLAKLQFQKFPGMLNSVDLIIPNMVETVKITNAGITENDFLTNNITIPDVDQRHSICLCAVRGTSLHTMGCLYFVSFKPGTLCTNMHEYNTLFYSESKIDDKISKENKWNLA